MVDRNRTKGSSADRSGVLPIDNNEESKGALTRSRGVRVSKAVLDKRVGVVANWLIQGHRNRTIYALVSESTKKEAERRATALKESKPLPPFVWGDHDPPCSTHMIDEYIRKARVKFELTGRELTKKGVEVLGMTWERSNDLYWRALNEKRYGTCRMILRDQMEMFGLIGAIKVQLVAPGEGSGAESPDTSHLPETEHTEEQLASAWRELLSMGLARVRADPSKYLPPGAPVSVQDAPQTSARDDDALLHDDEPDERES
jgi:hypothetical protein